MRYTKYDEVGMKKLSYNVSGEHEKRVRFFEEVNRLPDEPLPQTKRNLSKPIEKEKLFVRRIVQKTNTYRVK